jgi:PAS domain S-box-containing protein
MDYVRTGLGCSRTGIGVAAACLALVAAVWLVTLERIRYEQAHAVRETYRQSANLALALEEQTTRAFKSVDQALQRVRHGYEENGGKLDLHAMTADGAFDMALFGDIGIFDARGDLLLRNREFVRLNIADRELFTYHRDEADSGLYIGRPILARTTGEPRIPVSRRLLTPNGEFGGVVSALVSPTYFEGLFEQIDLGKHAMVLLAGRDGIVRVRWQAGDRSAGRDLRGSILFDALARRAYGNVETTGRTDGVVRYMSYRKVQSLPLVVAVATAKDEVLADVRARERAYKFGAWLTTVLIALLFAAFVVAERRQSAARREKLQTEKRYRATFDQAAVGIAHSSLDGTLLKVNRRLCDILGYAEAELVGRNVRDLTHPEDRAMTERALKEYVERPNQVHERLETRSVRKDGGLIWVGVTASLVRDAEGNPDYLVTMVQDITRRVADEALLREQLDELRRFHAVSVDRELRMEELERELALKNRVVA